MKKVWLRLRAILSTAPAVIMIEDGSARTIRGDLSNSLLSEFSDLAEAEGIDDGLIIVDRTSRGTVLRFSGPFSAGAKQRFRNVWFAHPARKM